MLAADAILNFIALLGVFLAFIGGLRCNKTALDEKLSALYGTLTVFLAARQAFYFFDLKVLVILIMAAGAWLPLIILLVAEEVLRRHAPFYVKIMLLSGAIFFSVSAVIFGAIWTVFWLAIFAIYAGISIFTVTAFLFANRKNQNSPSETQMADSFAIALIICAVAIIPEFRGLFPNIPVTFGALGILVFVLTTFSLSSESGSPKKLGIELFVLWLSATALTAAIWLLYHNLQTELFVRVWVFAFAINIVLLVIYRNVEKMLQANASSNFIQAISQIDSDASLDSLIAAHPMTAAGNIISNKELQLYGDEIITEFSRHNILSRETFTDHKKAEALGNLLDENGANYLLRLNTNPPKFLAIATGTIGFNKQLEAELRIFAHLSESHHNESHHNERIYNA